MAKRRIQYQVKTEPVFVPAVAVVPDMDWLTPLSMPVRAKPTLHPSLQDATTDIYPVITVDRWFNGLSLPARAKQRAIADYAFAPLAISEVVTIDKWFNSLAPPLYAKRGLATYEQQFTAFTPENFPSCGLVGVDTEGTGLVGLSSVTSIDYTGITVGDGPNRALVAMVQTDTNTVGMAAVWDQGGTNQAMTLIGTSTGASQTVAIFGLRNPIGGNKTLRFSWTTAGFPTVTAVSLITVDQSSDANAFKSYQSNTSGASSVSVTVPSKPGDIVVGIGCAAGPTVTAVGNNNIYIDNTSVGNHSGAGWNVGAASVTFTGTSSTAGNWLLGAIDVSAYPCPIDTDFILPFSELPRRKAALHPSLLDLTTDVYPTTAEVVTVDKWFDALSEPTRAKRGLNAALQVTYTTEYFPDTVNANAGQWFGSFTEPLRVKSRFSALYQSYTTEYYRDTFTQWFTPFSEPTRVKQRLTSDQGWVPFVTTAEVITVDKWFGALSEPIRARQNFKVSDQGYVPLVTTEIVTVDRWFNPLADPTRTIRITKVNLFPFSGQAAAAETVTVDKWFDAFSEPVRTKSQLATALQQSLAFVKAAPFPGLTESHWDQAWSEPVRQRLGLSAANQAAFFAPSTVITPEIVTVDKWFDPLSEPIRTRPALGAALQPATTYDAKLSPDPANFLEGWSSRLAEPVRQKLGLNTALQSVYTTGYFSFEIITVDKWYTALSEPKRFRPALHVSLQQTVAQDTVFIPNPSRYMEGWFGGLAEPVRQKTGLRAAQQPDLTEGPLTVAEVVTVDKWYASLSLPVRTKPSLATALQQAFAAPSTVITTETITVDKWFSGLSAPTKPKPGDYDRYKGENEFTAIAANMKWYAPLAGPVRQKIGLPVNQQQTLAYVATTVSTEVITVDKWFKSYADPVRAKHPTDDRYAGENNWEAIAASMEWFAPFTEPVRFKPGLVPATRPPFFASPTVIIIPSLASWWRPLAEPPKGKVSLGTHLQRAFTQDPKLFPNPSRFLEGWYNWWSEPVRHLAQLNAALQRSWTASDRRPVLATITVSMAVTEVNDDVALFAIKVFAGNPPVTAVVSLVEIGHGASLTSLVEEANIGLSGGAPIILSVSPQFGAPGTLLTITGRNFTSVTSVTIDGLAASFTIVDDSTILATVP